MINNPFDDPLFIPVIFRISILFLMGFLLVLLMNFKKINKFSESEVWKRYSGWFLIAPVFFLSVFLGGIVSLFFVLATSILALNEFRKLSLLRIDYFLTSLLLLFLTFYIAWNMQGYFYLLPIALLDALFFLR